MTKYIELENPRGTIFIREDKLSELAKVDTIVFDCDGVLLDVRNAYNVTIAATTKFLIDGFTSTVIPDEIFDSELNYSFKKTGGFNNDWTHTYAIIMRRAHAGKDFLFSGVYLCVHSSENVKNNFKKLGSDIVTPTVNEIPLILRYARGETL